MSEIPYLLFISVVDSHLFRSVGSYQDPVGSEEMYCAVCPLLRAKGFSCSLEVLHWGLGINILECIISEI
jgi:hypothetical protein